MSIQVQGASDVGRHSVLRSLLLALLTGLVFAAAGAALALCDLAERLLPHILTTNQGLEFQEIVVGRPIPRLLDWSFTQIGLLNELRDGSIWTVCAGALIFLALWIIIIRILNPTFNPLPRRILSQSEPVSQQRQDRDPEAETNRNGIGAGSEQSPSEFPPSGDVNTASGQTHITIDRIHVEQAVRILLAAGLPVLAVWYVTGAFGNEPIVGRGHQTRTTVNLIEIAQYVALGIGIFAGYSQSGLAGRFGIIHRAYQSDEAVAPVRPKVRFSSGIVLVLKGCLFGAVIWGMRKCSIGVPENGLLNRLHALGTFNRALFSWVFRSSLSSAAILWFSAGIIIYLLGKPQVRPAARTAMALIPIIGVFALLGIRRPFAFAAMASRYDTTAAVLAAAQPYSQKRPIMSVPVGEAAAQELARRVPIHVTGSSSQAPYRDMVVFDPKGTFEVEIDEVTDDGLITDHVKCADVQAFLAKRKYQTALSWAAVKYLFNDANIRFDQTAEIRYGLDDLEFSPHMLNTGETLRAIFFLCPASPQNLSLLDEYAGEARFAHPTRDSQRMMGDIYTRFGDVPKALSWYRRADMPHSFMKQVESEKPLFHAGTVTGKLTMNGAPLAGVQVGAAPQRLNGLPVDLQPSVLHYDEELAGIGRDPNPLFSRYHPRPFHLRWIMGGTTTGADGSFTLDHLTEGEYFLVCTLPAKVELSVPLDPRLIIQHIPPAFTLNYSLPTQDLGVIAFRY